MQKAIEAGRPWPLCEPLDNPGMDQYLLRPFLGDEHPFTSYFDVHQGYKVLTHCHPSAASQAIPSERLNSRGMSLGWNHPNVGIQHDTYMIRTYIGDISQLSGCFDLM